MSARQGVQIGFAVVGAVVGAYFGQPQLGLAVGSILGSVVANAAFPLDPIINKQENLADVSITSAALGTMKPILYGRWPLGGNVIWAYPKIEIERTTESSVSGGGKGGLFGGQKAITVTTEYRVHLMLALCEGPVSRITKIFFDATLVYDESQPQGWEISRGLPDGDPDIADNEEAPDCIIYDKPGEALTKFVLFRGTETQEPWAFAESLDDPDDPGTLLTGKLPAYRGTVVVGVSLDLGPTGRVPNIRCEVATADPTSVRPQLIIYSAVLGEMWMLGATGTLETSATAGGAIAVKIDYSTGEETITQALSRYTSDITGTPTDNRVPVAVGLCDNINGEGAIVVQHADSVLSIITGGKPRTGIDPRTEAEIDDMTLLGAGSVDSRPSDNSEAFYTTLIYTLPTISSIGQIETDTGAGANAQRLVVSTDPHTIRWNNTETAIYVSCQGADVVERITGYTTLAIDESISVGARPTALIVDAGGLCWVTCKDDDEVYHFTATSDLSSAIAVGTSPDDLTQDSEGFIWVANTGESTVSRIDPADDSVETFDIPGAPLLVRPYIADGKCYVVSAAARSVYLVDPADGSYTVTQIPRGAVDATVDGGGNLWVACETARQLVRVDGNGNLLQQEVSSGLACVVRDINRRAGVPEDWIDTSGLDSTPVNYAIFGIASASRALDDLALAYQFVGIEGGNGLKYFFKGGVPIASISEDDCIPDSDGQSITVERAYQQEIPTDITVVYRSPVRHFHDDEQHVAIPNPPASGRIYEVVNVAVGFEDAQEARNLAEVLLYEPRFARFALKFRLPAKAQSFEPGDLLEVTQGSDTYHAHLTNVTIGQDGSVDCQAIRWRSYLYEGFAAIPGDSVGATAAIPQPAAVSLAIVEPPALPMDDTTPYLLPLYRRATANGFLPSAVLYESTDGGTNYSAIATLSTQSPVGRVPTAIASADTAAWDDTTVITVVVDSGITLSSASDAQVANGSNRCLIGSECVQFGIATLTAPSTYELTHLLRGRRGTEQYVSTHSNNETFVLLSASLLGTAIDFPVSAIGQTRYYKLVPQGKTITDVTAVTYTLLGTNIKPWAPVVLDLERDNTTNEFTLTWYHRSRLRGDLVAFSGISYDPDDLQTYEVAIYSDDTYSTVQATYITDLFASAEGIREYIYTAEQQEDDFGALQANLSLGLRQRVLGVQGYESQITTLDAFELPYSETFENLTVTVTETAEGFEP